MPERPFNDFFQLLNSAIAIVFYITTDRMALTNINPSR